MESADPYCSEWKKESQTAAPAPPWSVWDSVHTRSAAVMHWIFYILKHLMTISKLHSSFHRSIQVSFCLFAVFFFFMCNEFCLSTGYERGKRGCVFMYFILIGLGLFNSIAAYPYLEGQWKSFENQWAEAGKTKIIDCFQTPAGGGITNQNSSQGSLKLVLQILQPHIQTEKNANSGNPFQTLQHMKFILCISCCNSLIYRTMLMVSED